MRNWWHLGEGSGYRGRELELYRITCPFCTERGNFGLVNREQKKKPNGNKVLNFDTLKCGCCSSYVMVLWSANESGDLYSYEQLPWPAKPDSFPEHWPQALGRYWLQAQKCLNDESWDAAALMARSALQVAMREQQAKGNNLRQEIDDLANKGLLPPVIKEWAHTLRELGNDSAHPHPSQVATTQADAIDTVRFLGFLLDYLYNLPHRIAEYRQRREKKETTDQ